MFQKKVSLFVHFLTFLGVDTSPKHLKFSKKIWENSDINSVLEIDDNTKIYIPENYDYDNPLYFPALKVWPLKGKKIAKYEDGLNFKKSSDKNFFRFNFLYEKGVDFYGGGEVVGPLKRNGTKIKLWNTDNFAYMKFSGERLYQSHPFIMGVNRAGKSFGLIFCTTYPAQLEIKNIGVLEFTSYSTPFPVIKFEYDNPSDVIKKLASLTGKIEMPPLWALGYQQSRWSYYPDSRVREIADEFRKRELPCDVIWLDIHYMDGYRIFTFDNKSFPKPEKLFEYLHKNNFKVVCMIDPAPKKDKKYFVYEQGVKNSYFIKDEAGDIWTGEVWPGESAFPDWSNDETCIWWQNLYKPFMDKGVDGIWNDMNEPSVFDGPDGTMSIDCLHTGGKNAPEGKHLQYHNIYGMLMVKESMIGMLKANPEKRVFLLTRSNFLGGQRYAATWTGDNKSTQKDLLLSIPMCLTLGISGQPFCGVDVGGFAGIGTGELMADWMGVSAFFPLYRGHAAIFTNDKEPWAYGAKVENSCKTSLERRYAILPYLYTLFYESYYTGLPIIRPAFFADLKDQKLRTEEVAFLLGDNLYVKPQFEHRVKKQIFLPAGNWVEIKLTGEDTDRDKSQPKIYLKEGTIIPITKPTQSTADYSVENLILYINPDASGYAEGFLYEDTNDGFNYKKGEYIVTKFICNAVKPGWKISTKKIEGKMRSKIKNFSIKIYNKNKIFCSDNLVVIK